MEKGRPINHGTPGSPILVIINIIDPKHLISHLLRSSTWKSGRDYLFFCSGGFLIHKHF